MNSTYPTPHQPSTHPPPSPRPLNYEVLHFENRGENQISSTKIGTFTTLQHAQAAAQNALRSALDSYLAAGWMGYYCNAIDLISRGLITGLVSALDYECLSEIHIYARARSCESFPGQPVLSEPWSEGPSSRHTHTYAGHEEVHFEAARIPPNSPHPQPPHTSPSFSQTRPPYPNRPPVFFPRSAHYDQVMSFSRPRSAGPALSLISTSAPTAATAGHTHEAHGYGKDRRPHRGEDS